MNKVKIAYVAPSMGKGGTERQITALLHGLNKDDYDIYLLLFNDKIEYELPKNVKLIYLNKRSKLDIRFLYRLFKVLRILKPDIIQSCISGVNKYILIYSFLFNFRNIIISQRTTKVYKEYRFLRFFNNIKKIKCAIVNSNQGKFELIQHSRMDEGSIHVIYNGIDLNRFKKTDQVSEDILKRSLDVSDGNGKRFIVLVPGRICKNINQLIVLKALSFLKGRNLLPKKLLILFLGDAYENSYFQQCNSYTQSNYLQGNAVFEASKNEIELYYNLSDLVCLPSFKEGCSNVILEAMSCEKPVIVSSGANSDQFVKDKENGWVFDESDYGNLAQIILEAYFTEKPLLQVMGKNNRQVVSSYFSAEKLLMETEKIYKSLL